MTKQNEGLVQASKISYRQFLMESPEARTLFVNASSFKMKKIFKMVYQLSDEELDSFILSLESKKANAISVQ